MLISGEYFWAERDLSDFIAVDGKLVGYDSGIDFMCHFVWFKQWYKIIYGKLLIRKEKYNTIKYKYEKSTRIAVQVPTFHSLYISYIFGLPSADISECTNAVYTQWLLMSHTLS